MNTKEVYRALPEAIKSVLILSDGWLVGGAITDILDGKKPTDYDIVVPPDNYQIATLYLAPFPFKFNSFGGLKFSGPDYELDIWPEEIGHFINTAHKFTYAFNLKNAKFIKNVI